MLPTTKNLTILQGDSFDESDESFQLYESGGLYLDLTNWTITAQVRLRASTDIITATFTVVEDDVDAGLFHLELAPATTSALSAGSYVWDCQIVHTITGEVRTVFRGTVTVEPEVTR